MKKYCLLFLSSAISLASCDNLKKPETKDQPQEATADTAVVYREGRTVGSAAMGAANSAAAAVDNAWNMTTAKLVDVKFREITTPGVTVRGDAAYNVYSIDEKVLFDTDKAAIRPGAAEALRQIAGSIGQRYVTSKVRVLGFADARGDKGYNKELSAQRAEAVKNYLVATGRIEAARVSVEPMGEALPVASNATAVGRQENRRVEIAVRTK